jgi:hypothetical protein
MKFILKDRPFTIRSAELFATIPDPSRLRRGWLRKYWRPRKYDPESDPRPFWSLEVWVEGEMDGEVQEARATAEEMRFPVRRWVDVAGQVVEWSEPNGAQHGRPYGLFYLGEHEMIGRARLRFTERDGAAFWFEWEGVCDVFWGEEYGRDVPFSVAGWARFTGVTVGGGGADTDETLRERLAQYFDPRDFIQGPLIRRSYRLGFFRRIESSHAVFTPSEARAG